MLNGWGFVEGQDSWHSLVSQGNATYECDVYMSLCMCVCVCNHRLVKANLELSR